MQLDVLVVERVRIIVLLALGGTLTITATSLCRCRAQAPSLGTAGGDGTQTIGITNTGGMRKNHRTAFSETWK